MILSGRAGAAFTRRDVKSEKGAPRSALRALQPLEGYGRLPVGNGQAAAGFSAVFAPGAAGAGAAGAGAGAAAGFATGFGAAGFAGFAAFFAGSFAAAFFG